MRHDSGQLVVTTPSSTSGADRRTGTLLIAGVPVDDIDMDGTLNEIWEFVRRGRAQHRTFQVATVNVDFVVNALLDRSVARVLRSTALSIPDGMPLVWGARLLGGALRTRVAGADLVPLMCERAANDGTRIAFIGAAPGVAERAATLLRERLPGLELVATEGPSFRHLDEVTTADIDQLSALDADIGCFAFGHPKQDAFIERFADELSIPVMIGVGGSLDFLIGEQHRAPRWMQKTGLEWLHRAGTDPRRLVRRYARDFRVFFPALARQAWGGRSTSNAGTLRLDTAPPNDLIVDLTDIATMTNSVGHEIATAARLAALDDQHVRFVAADGVDLGRVAGLSELIDAHSEPALNE